MCVFVGLTYTVLPVPPVPLPSLPETPRCLGARVSPRGLHDTELQTDDISLEIGDSPCEGDPPPVDMETKVSVPESFGGGGGGVEERGKGVVSPHGLDPTAPPKPPLVGILRMVGEDGLELHASGPNSARSVQSGTGGSASGRRPKVNSHALSPHMYLLNHSSFYGMCCCDFVLEW